MANLFFTGEKLSKQEAINTLTVEISNYYDGRYEVQTSSDDGGSVLEVFVEVPVPSTAILDQCVDFPLYEIVPKWGGWRCQVIKCPIGYIDTILLSSEADDY
jgi:hypothetical protein|tara:strand:- start:683 stop:988 length:306 start_codon:yes stop_codon:yes gene_type:complete